jgi:hypothetical protein
VSPASQARGSWDGAKSPYLGSCHRLLRKQLNSSRTGSIHREKKGFGQSSSDRDAIQSARVLSDPTLLALVRGMRSGAHQGIASATIAWFQAHPQPIGSAETRCDKRLPEPRESSTSLQKASAHQPTPKRPRCDAEAAVSGCQGAGLRSEVGRRYARGGELLGLSFPRAE